MTGPREVSHTPRARTRRSGAVRTRMRSERTMSLARLIRPSTPANGESHTPSTDRKSTRLNSSHGYISYAVFCLKKKKNHTSREVRFLPTDQSIKHFRFFTPSAVNHESTLVLLVALIPCTTASLL